MPGDYYRDESDDIYADHQDEEDDADANEELADLLAEEWRLHPYLSMSQIVARLAEPDRTRALELLSQLEQEGDE